MAIVMVLAGIVYPHYSDIGDLTRPSAMAVTVRQVRTKIFHHTGLGETQLSQDGFPNSIEPSWFSNGMPVDVWTNQPLNVQVVHGGKDAVYPNNESFVIKPDGRPAGHTAWYNAANGAFCVLVPMQGTKDERQELFSRVNGVGPTSSHG
jgi:hypothetical protein